MKLIELTVKNFRSIRGEGVSLSLNDSDIIFLLGKNNAGKSTLLAAYEYLVTANKKAVNSDFSDYDSTNEIEIIATFLKEEGDNETFDERGLNQWVDDDSNKILIKKSWTTVDQPGQKSTYNPTTGEFQPNGFGGIEQILTKHAPTAIRIPAIPSTADLTKFIKDIVQKSVLRTLKTEEAEAYGRALQEMENLQSLVLSNEILKKKSDQANKNFKKLFPNLSLDISPIEGKQFNVAASLEKEFSVVIKDEQRPDSKPDFMHHGHGVIRQTLFNFLGIVKNDLQENEGAYEGRKEYMILFEEPEVYLHPKAIRALRSVLYDLCSNSQFQLICASHSPSLIDISKPHTTLVRVHRDDQGTTHLYQVGDDVFSASDDVKNHVQMINRFDPNICESFFSDVVILVEGDTEAIVIREILNRKYDDRDIFVVNTGSKNNIPFFQTIFNHFNIKQHIIHDCDTKFLYNKINVEGRKTTYVPRLNKDGTKRKNSAWALNDRIWQLIVQGNELQEGLARRYVSIYDFESANDYVYDTSKGKPLSAYEFAKGIDLDGEYTILKVLDAICNGYKYQSFSTAELEDYVKEPNE